MKNKKSFLIPLLILSMMIVFWHGLGVSIAESVDQKTSTAELCAEHGFPVDQCFYCDPSLRERGRLWCGEHGRYEDRCFMCHPELKDPTRLWCDEHHLYEDECIFCHPELVKISGSPAVSFPEADEPDGLQCLEHRVAEDDCGICHPDLLASLAVGEGLLIRFESEMSTTKAGVVTALPTEGVSLVGLTTLCRVTYDLNHLVRITPLTKGVVRRVLVDVGDVVVQGQPLLEIYSSEVALAKNEYVSSLALTRLKKQAFERAKKLSVGRVSSQKAYEQALADFQVATNTTLLRQQQLQNLGLTDQQVQEVGRSDSISSGLLILAPFAGTLVERNLVVGDAVEPGDRVLTLVDLSSMWLEISIPEDRLVQARPGYFVEASFTTRPGLISYGRLSWIASDVAERSRVVKARAVIPNHQGLLRHGMFGKVRISEQQNGSSLKVPVGAVHVFSGEPFVFVKKAEDLYEIRRVRLGGRDGTRVDVLAGIKAGDQVAVTHSFILKSEYLKSRLGAGCVDD